MRGQLIGKGTFGRTFFSPLDATAFRFNRLLFNNYPMFKALRHDYRTGEQTAKQWYGEYIAEIQQRVPKEKLALIENFTKQKMAATFGYASAVVALAVVAWVVGPAAVAHVR
ncbi:hypothetical protein LTR74_018282 [Friedmanniomyces endolithicus]|nr:hypothetical protein LTR74_018282 [Friedmanniomyces endolithicus]